LSLEDLLKVSIGQRARVILIQKKGLGIGEKEIISGRVDAVTDKAFIIDGRTYPRAVWDLVGVHIFARSL